MEGWTVDTSRESILDKLAEMDRRYEQRFESGQEAVKAALNAAKEAVGKAEYAAEKRFDSVNEFRGQLSDQAATFMPRLEAEQRIAQLAEKIADMSSRQDVSIGRSGGFTAGFGYLVAAIGAATAIVVAAIALLR